MSCQFVVSKMRKMCGMRTALSADSNPPQQVCKFGLPSLLAITNYSVVPKAKQLLMYTKFSLMNFHLPKCDKMKQIYFNF